MEIIGKVVQILPEQKFNSKNGEISKNSFVIEWSDNGYTQKLCLDVIGAEKFEKMKNSIRVGNDVTCRFSVTSREFHGRWFTSCNCFYCASVNGIQPTQQQAPQQSAPQQAVADSLPF